MKKVLIALLVVFSVLLVAKNSNVLNVCMDVLEGEIYPPIV